MKCALVFLLLSIAAAAQSPQKLEICELIQNAAKYDHQEIEVRAQVNVAFEDFTLEDEKCGDSPNYRPVWLTYGSDQPGPTPSTTNDNTRRPGQYLKISGKTVPLVRDGALSLFRRRIIASRHVPNDALFCRERACNFYRVTATLRGIFLAASGKPFEGKSYGHLGCCSLLAIEQVSDVEAVRTAVPAGGEYKCTDQKREIEDATLSGLKRRHCDNFRDCQLAMAEFIAQIVLQHGDDRIDPQMGSTPLMEFGWISDDLLTSYWFSPARPAKKKRPGTSAVLTKRTCVATKLPLPLSTPVACEMQAREFVCDEDK